ncbi:MAG: sialate O-acetylesterase [Chitinivibrionales bacterium]|nr:sialate O-acetylesterase [Chitinivibrionales bacterium]
MRQIIKHTILFSVLSAAAVFGQTVTFLDSAKPANMQFVGRDDQDSGVVAIAGSVTTAGADSVSVTVYKGGVLYKRIAQALSYSGGSAPFSLAPKIHAELASYKVEVRAGATVVLTADSILCGDGYITAGQSNGGNLDQPDTCRWIRSWYYSWQHPAKTAGGLGSLIADRYHIPTFFMNGAVGGSPIEWFLGPNGVAANMFSQIKAAGITGAIKASLWHQGEANSSDTLNATIGYDTMFTGLCNDWKRYYPNLKHIYMFQIHQGCGGPNYERTFRNTQRVLQQKIPNLSTISTGGIVAHDGCHYGSAGYYEMGAWVFPLIGRDVYKSADSININSPNIIAAKFDDEAHTRITMQFDVPVKWPADTTIPNVGGPFSMKDYFYLGKDENGFSVASGSADTNARTVTLVLKQATADTQISYTPEILYPGNTIAACYEGPWLVSTRGVGALTFYKFPIGKSLITTSVKPSGGKPAAFGSLTFTMNKERVTISVKGLRGPCRLEIVRPNGSVAARLNNVGPAGFGLDRKMVPAGTYLIRATDANGAGAAKLAVWY